MDTKSILLKPVPPPWKVPLAQWETVLRAANSSDRTIDTRLRNMRRVARAFPTTDPTAVTDEELLDWCGHRRWAAETRHGHYTSIKAFYRWLSSVYGCEDPSAILPTVRRGQTAPRPAPERVFEEGLDRSHERVRLMLYLAGCAGLRAGEIAVVHRNDLHQDLMGTWGIYIHGKGGKTRTVPLKDWLGVLLARAANISPTGYVFPGQISGHLSPRWVTKLGSLALEDPWTLHSLRHRFATRAYAAERDLLTVQQLLGHASVATTQRYAKPPETALLAAIDAADVRRPAV